jgi:DNA sulfur modification protein DndB
MTRSYFPALRGRLGDWAFYSILMTLEQLATRVAYAKQIHKSKKLSELIQRELDDKDRASEIGGYLLENDDRFFNSLVVAIYGGDPEWHEFQNVKPVADDIKAEDVSYGTRYSVGYLSLSGNEKLFALDGQHRLAGIRNALGEQAKLGDEEVSVIVVAHHSGSAGLRRTRKLFTTLNKTARPVSKSEIIALDEADAMAITARRLVENDKRFGQSHIDIMRKQANLPSGNTTHLTTLVNLYDILEIIFTKSSTTKPDLKRARPTDEELDKFEDQARGYFNHLAKAFPPLGSCFRSREPTKVISKYRNNSGGHILFRPIGLLIFAEVAGALVRTADLSLRHCVEELKRLPIKLSKYPYAAVLWDPQTKTINVGRRALIRDMLLYYLGRLKDQRRIKNVEVRYKEILGDQTARLVQLDP